MYFVSGFCEGALFLREQSDTGGVCGGVVLTSRPSAAADEGAPGLF